ncbi:hypothetical protein [Flavobacterium sp.]|uniref:hypothetical protein n=1 Tax=Flavobacterium sp. TaxID=239 RepID=UPI004048C47E
MKKIFILIFLLVNSTFLYSQNNQDEPIWWKWEREGKYLEVTSHLLYKVQSDSIKNEHADYLHIARNYGYLNDYEKAIFYLKKSMTGLEEKNDEQFWWYYQGTLAFFERNKDKLKIYLNKLKNNHSNYYKNNYLTLKSLYENFEKGYFEASRWKNNQTNN